MEHRSLSPDFIVSNDDHVGGNKCTRESTPDVAPQELRKEEQMGGPVNCNDSELSIYLQALAEGYLPTFYSDTSQSAQSKSMSIASKSFRRGKKTVVFHGFPSLKMSRHSTAIHGAALLTWWREASRVKTYPLRGGVQDLTESAAACGTTWPASLAKYDPASHTLKTAQLSLLEDLTGCSVTLPRWGLMRNGECWERQTLVPRTNESASGLWPTPVKTDGFAVGWCKTSIERKERGESRPSGAKIGSGLRYFRRTEKYLSNGYPNPMLTEWLMGWPTRYTDLQPLETAKFQEWQQQHSIY